MKGLYKRSRNIAWDDYPVKAKTSNARKVLKRINEKRIRKSMKKQADKAKEKEDER